MIEQYLPLIIGAVGLGVAFTLDRLVSSYPVAEGLVAEIGEQIHKGAMTFMRREYRLLAMFCAALVVGLLLTLGWKSALACLVGALTSAIAGWLGMFTATKANVRTATAARDHGQGLALTISFFGGSVMGMSVAAFGLLGIGFLYVLFGGDRETAHAIHGFGVGASSVALFSRVGGGIFTKSADVGADLVGKTEAGIPEDDPRNPGVIADNVGDNVGDIAGMGSDIFESYCGAMIAAIAIAATLSDPHLSATLAAFPLLLASLGLLSAIAFIFVVKLRSESDPASALRTATIGAPILFALLSIGLVHYLQLDFAYWWAVVVGAVGGVGIGLITEYYTGGKPVQKIAQSAETGSATVLITGLSIGMVSVVGPIILLSLVILISTALVGIYGVAIAAVGMLATVGITMAIDAYGPVADNAGGIAEMSGMGKEVRDITDGLDELGNTTAAIGKGFAIGAAALAALAIISAFIETILINNPEFSLEVADPKVLIGMLIGAAIPFFIASVTMAAVGDAAMEMVQEIRRQFREIKGLLEGTAKPDTERCIDIATRAAMQRMFTPAAVAVLVPIVIGFVFGAGALGGMLAGSLVCCVAMALFMANTGGAWDNSKKYIEKGNFGGKGSDAHKAAVVGDTVGDPFKDTSGPSMNILINVMAIVSLTISPLLTTTGLFG